MAEIEKVKDSIEENKNDTEQEVTVELGEPASPEQVAESTQNFYANLADDMDERTLQRLSKQLVDDYKKDKISRKDWEQGYTKGLDLLGFKYTEMTRPFKGSASVTHPLLAEAVTQFQAQAYKELIPSDGPVRAKVIGALSKDKVDQADG